MKKSVTALLASCCLVATLSAQAAPKLVDRVAVLVNSGVILESEIQDLVNNVKAQASKNNQDLPSDRALRTQATDKLISDSLLLQLGERMGVKISDAQLDAALEQMAQENKTSLTDFRLAVINDGTSWEKYRENIRKEIAASEVRRAAVRQRIYIAPQEVENLLKMMREQTNANVEYHLGHILIAFPAEPTQKDVNDAKDRAQKVVELLKNGSDFTKIAIASSSDENALKGGDMGWFGINEMPTLFSKLVDGQDKGGVFGPVRTGLGFSIVKILDIRGKQTVEVEEVKARHILIKPSIILSDEKAKEKLAGFLADIKAGKADFAELAKQYSEGPTGVKGGDLGWSDPNVYDPAFKEALAKLKVDEYSEPFRSSFGWHIAQLTGRRMIDATKQMNTNRAYQLLFNRKFGVEAARWLKELRDEAHIEVIESE